MAFGGAPPNVVKRREVAYLWIMDHTPSAHQPPLFLVTIAKFPGTNGGPDSCRDVELQTLQTLLFVLEYKRPPCVQQVDEGVGNLVQVIEKQGLISA
jgi:hypothetical protein